MLMPASLPTELMAYASAENEAALFTALSKRPDHLVLFFEIASENETWSEHHSDFMRQAIEWSTKQFFNQQLSLALAERIAKAICKHFSVQRSFLISDLTIHMQGQQAEVNSLMLSVNSDVFRERIWRECHQKGLSKLVCNEIPNALFHHIVEFVYSGMALRVWKESQEDIFALLRLSSQYRLSGLMEICEETLRRYINRSNALEMLVASYQASWNLLKTHCMQLLNDQALDVRLFEVHANAESGIPEPLQPFGLEFLAFSDRALEVFEQVKPFITHLVCSGTLTEEAPFSTVVRTCPKLVALDISQSRVFSERLSDIPNNVLELDLSKCPWLTNSIIQKMVSICPQLKRLKLQSNVQLTFVGWGELQKLRQLQALDISRCNQVSDEDFALILKACAHLVELRVDECKKLTDNAFFSLTRSLPQLLVLSVVRCHLSDGLLYELVVRCRHIHTLNLTKCLEISEKGLLRALPHARELRRLTIVQCPISDEAVAMIRKSYPLLSIITD